MRIALNIAASMLLLALLGCLTGISTVASSAVRSITPSDMTASSSSIASIDAHVDDQIGMYDISINHQIHLKDSITGKRDTPTTNNADDDGSGWTILTREFSILLPLSAGSAALESFYQSVIDQATVYSGSEPTSRDFTLKKDDMTLNFYSANMEIPWNVVSGFASDMLQRVRQGFTGRFYTVYCIAPTESSSKLL